MLAPLGGGGLMPLGVTQGATPLLLDLVTGAANAYSFRKLRAAYAGSAVRIRRDSDNAESDIGFSGTNFDTAAAAAFIGAGSGYLTKWYDQSGNARDWTQASTTLQPLYVPNASGSNPVAQFDATNDELTGSGVAFTDLTVFLAVNKTYNGSLGTIVAYTQSGINRFRFAVASSVYGMTHYNGSTFIDASNTGTVTTTIPHLFSLQYVNSPRAIQMWINAALQTGTFGVSSHQTHNIQRCDAFELVVWGSALSTANRQTVEANINTYYTIY